MLKTTQAKRLSIVAAAAGVVAAGALAASALVGAAAGSTANLRPICNNLWFNPPGQVGESVIVPVHTVVADPDVEPVQLVSLFGGAPLGTARIVGNDFEFTLTSSEPGETRIYWTFSDGALTVQCSSGTSNAPDPDNG
jgi:hypothetical protein